MDGGPLFTLQSAKSDPSPTNRRFSIIAICGNIEIGLYKESRIISFTLEYVMLSGPRSADPGTNMGLCLRDCRIRSDAIRMSFGFDPIWNTHFSGPA